MKYLSFLWFIFPFSTFGQQGLQVDVNTYTHQELIEQVLLQQECSIESLGTVSTYGAHLFTDDQSFSYFTNDSPIIPFESGIILTSGFVSQVDGPNDDILSGGLYYDIWQGDSQLFDYVQDQGIDPELNSYENATFVEFDFVPLSERLSFDYIFLSEEYGEYQCEYSDAFAFFLTDLQTNEITNLAIVPETDDPVSVLTIRDEQYYIGTESNCGSLNEDFFNNYYPMGELPLSQSPHNFNGDTKVLTASASVIPGRSYNIKLVVADRNDSELDSAVLIEEGSFSSLTLDLGNDKVVCDELLLEAPMVNGAIYEWTYNNNVISGEASNTLLANQTGEYTLSMVINGQTCTLSDTINVTIIGDININTIPAYNYQQGEVIDLEIFIPQLIEDVSGVNITFHESQQYAEQGTNPINNPQNYQINGNTIWVRIESENNSDCFVITSIEMLLNSEEEITVCDDDFDGIYTFNFDTLLQQLEQEYGTANSRDIVYIANSYTGLSMIEDVSTNPNFVHLCDTNFTAYEVAVDQNQDVYLSSNNNIYKVDLDNCTFQNVGTLPDGSRGAMSFDTQNNLYVGSFNHSKVYRANAGQFQDFYEWKDFYNGTSGGDFVVIGSYMYIAWVENGNDVLYRAELGANNEYISHINLGQIQTNTYGLAAENGKLYGVTPDFLYEIDLDTMNTNVVLNRTGSTGWWGAAGLHESSGSNISFHETQADAQSGQNELGITYTNTTAFQQTIYIRVYNQATGNIIVIPLNLTVNTSPETTAGFLNDCQGGTNPSYNLEDAIPQMLSDTNGITITYYTSQQDAENGNAPINPQGYTPTSVPETVYVTFDNGICSPSINTITLNNGLVTTPAILTSCQEVIAQPNEYNFNLSTAIADMIDDATDVDLSFYEAEQDAIDSVNALDDGQEVSYITDIYPRVIYVRFQKEDCFSINTITLEVEPMQTQELPSIISICEGETKTIEIEEFFTGYVWYGDQVNTYPFTNSMDVYEAGFVYVYLSRGGCAKLHQFEIIVENDPVFQDVLYDDICSNTTSEEISISTLLNELNQINNSFYYELYLTTNDAESGTNVLSGVQQINDGQQLIIKVKNNASSNCYSLYRLDIDFLGAPVVDLEEEYAICEGETLSLSLNPNFNYTWTGFQGEDITNNDVSSNQVNLTQSGTYSVEVDNGNCNETFSFQLNYSPSAIIFSVEVDGNNITILSNGTPTAQYSINGQDWYNNTHFTELENGVYTAYIRDNSLCGTDNMDFVIFEINNVITPNGDGLNDVWKIVGLENYPDSVVIIYDRYGKEILNQKVEAGFYWDGTYAGKIVPSTDYWYVIQVSDGRKFTGHITVKNH